VGSTLDLHWTLRDDQLRLSYLENGCEFDETRALPTTAELERIG
jgi:hypothetical protein